MLTRLLLIIFGVILAVRFVRRLLAHARPAEPSTPVEEGPVRDMVQDPVCGTYIAKTGALTTVTGGATHYFCSSPCYRRFLGGFTAGGKQSA